MTLRARAAAYLTRLAAVLVASSTVADASVTEMECREWRGTTEGKPSYADPLGTYIFVYNTDAKSLSISFTREGRLDALFGDHVKAWKVLWAKELRATFYGIDHDFTGPVKILTVDFARARAFFALPAEIQRTPQSWTRHGRKAGGSIE
jgi:hypothetical protein